MAGKIDDKLAAEKQLFWQMLLGDEPPNWHTLQELHGIICMTEKALPEAVREGRLTVLHNAWRCALRVASPDWRYLEEIDRQIRAIEKLALAVNRQATAGIPTVLRHRLGEQIAQTCANGCYRSSSP